MLGGSGGKRKLVKGVISLMKRMSILALCLLLGLAFLVPQGLAQEPEVSWEEVDVSDLPAEVALWLEENHADRGVYVLPAGQTTYLLIAWGEKPTGGFTVGVEGAEHFLLGGIRVTALLEEPGPDDIVTQALTYPYQLIALEATHDTITVNFIGAPWFGDELGTPDNADPDVVLRAAGEPGEPVLNPLVVWGRARVWEATFSLVVEDGHNELARDVIMVADGGPSWAEFAVAVTLDRYTSPNGMVIAEVEDASDGTTREVAQVPIAFASVSRPFEDVRGHWAEAPIRRGVWNRFIHGYPDGTFRPEDTVTRAEFLKMLVASQAGDDFSVGDVHIPFADARDHWVSEYLKWALEAGWIPEGDFGEELEPDKTISRQEMALLAARAAGLEPSEEELTFHDKAEVDPFMLGWVSAAVENRLILGYPDGTFRPNDGLKRSEAVVVIWRVARSLAK